MANHTPPIVPHVLYVADQNRPWQLAPIERLATRYHTPTTVAVEFGTIDYTVQPQNGKSGVTKQQHHVWCLPNDAAWERVQACRQDYQQALDRFADELRRLGGYAKRLEERGGPKRAPNPLCPTVIAVDDPDSTDTHYFISNPVPRIQRAEISDHTPKMLHITRDAETWSTTHQRDHVVCPNDDAWRVVQARQRVAQDAADAWKTLLLQLGTYQRALGDGRYATLAQAALVPAAPAAVGVTMMTRDEAQACVARIAGGIETMRRDLLELYEREGWRALGYDSWRACAVAEFGASAATLYRQLEAAEIERDVRGADFSQVENNAPAIPTAQLQAVKDLPPAERRQAFDRADQLAAGRPRTAADVRQAAQAIRPTADPSIADGQHINQITQILRTLDQWDEREHTRLLQEAYSHARQIKDETRYAALMAEIDRTVAASAPPQPALRGQRPAPSKPTAQAWPLPWPLPKELADRAIGVGLNVFREGNRYRTMFAQGAANYAYHKSVDELAGYIESQEIRRKATVRPSPTPPASVAWWNVGEQIRAVQRAIDTGNRNDAIAAAQQLLAWMCYQPLSPRPRRPASADVSAQTRYMADLEQYALLLEVRLGAVQAAAPAPIENEVTV